MLGLHCRLIQGGVPTKRKEPTKEVRVVKSGAQISLGVDHSVIRLLAWAYMVDPPFLSFFFLLLFCVSGSQNPPKKMGNQIGEVKEQNPNFGY
jgi:hypothetical protein